MVQTISRYETYKPSGIDWIGEVPEHWEIIRVKGNCYVKGRIGWQELRAEEFIDEGIHCVTGTDFNNQFVNWDTCYRVSLERYLIDDNIQLKEGDVLITKDGTIGKTAIVKNLPEKATLNSGIFLVRPEKARLENEYLYWILNSKVFEDYNDYTKTGATILHLYQNVFVEMHFPLPDNEEQLSIANYLDDQTQKIDRLIANKKAQAEKLKELRQIEINNAVTKGLNQDLLDVQMNRINSPKQSGKSLNPENPASDNYKDSGIEWLGKMPKHWEVKRLKNLANQMSEKSSEILDDDFLVALENIESHTGQFIETSSEYENNGIKFKKDNLLYNKLRPYLNKVFLADKDGICVGDIIVIECTPKLHSAFLQFRMLSDSFCSIIMSSVYGAKMPRTSWQFISGLKIAFPPIEEQIQIANYLQKRTTAIDQLIKNIEAQIEKLQELRKIKIYEAVTGKLKVNGYERT